MFKENQAYNTVIKRQLNEYVRTKEQIQNRVNKILNNCNTHWLIGLPTKTDKKIEQLGGTDKLISIGGGGVIFKAKRKKYINAMRVTEILKERNLRINFYGALYYELGNYEYCLGLTPLRDILNNMGVKHTITDDNTFRFDNCYDIDPDLFNYVIDLYNNNSDCF